MKAIEEHHNYLESNGLLVNILSNRLELMMRLHAQALLDELIEKSIELREVRKGSLRPREAAARVMGLRVRGWTTWQWPLGTPSH